jgi:hypothetical protein
LNSIFVIKKSAASMVSDIAYMLSRPQKIAIADANGIFSRSIKTILGV